MTDTLTGQDRYQVYPSGVANTFHVWDHEDADCIPDRDGRIHLSQEDAEDLAAEYLG